MTSDTYDVVLMDLQMPIMDGRAATKEIRLYEKKVGMADTIPIIAMTADAMSGVRDDVINIGMNDYITKPINPPEVIKMLIKWIEPGNRPLPDEYTKKVKLDLKSLSSAVEIPHLDGINTDVGLSRVGGNKRLYLNLLKKFHHDNQGITEQISKAIEQQDQELAVRLAHTVKGLSGTIGAHVLQKIATNLEAAIKANFESGFNAEDIELKLLIDEFNTTLGMILKTLLPIISIELNEKHIDGKVVKKGDITQLSKYLEELLLSLQKRKPKPCKEIMEEINGFSWSDDIKSKIQELDRLIGKYKFKEAQEVVLKIIT